MGWTEAVRRYLTLRKQEFKVLARLDRTMMFESNSTFLMRTTRVVAEVRPLWWRCLPVSCS